eukprot:g1033.t1
MRGGDICSEMHRSIRSCRREMSVVAARGDFDDVDAGKLPPCATSPGKGRSRTTKIQRVVERELLRYSNAGTEDSVGDGAILLRVPSEADLVFAKEHLSVSSDSAASRLRKMLKRHHPTHVRFGGDGNVRISSSEYDNYVVDDAEKLDTVLHPSSNVAILSFDRTKLPSESEPSLLDTALNAIRQGDRDRSRPRVAIVIAPTDMLRGGQTSSNGIPLIELDDAEDEDDRRRPVADLPPWFWLPQMIVVTGPMFAGKTSRLIDFLNFSTSQIHSWGSPLVLKPDVDTRSPSESIRSHDGVTFPATGSTSSLVPANAGPGYEIGAVRVDLSADSRNEARSVVIENGSFVALDEAHFFDSSVVDFCVRVTHNQPLTTVLAGGLDLDYKRDSFGHLLDLSERLPDIAHTEALFSQCAVCGSPAPFTTRTRDTTDGEQVVVGAGDIYSPACALHHTIAP